MPEIDLSYARATVTRYDEPYGEFVGGITVITNEPDRHATPPQKVPNAGLEARSDEMPSVPSSCLGGTVTFTIVVVTPSVSEPVDPVQPAAGHGSDTSRMLKVELVADVRPGLAATNV